jgi:glycosyltransferase involved in cell wall biosynthesis
VGDAGVLVEPADENQIATAIGSLLNDQSLCSRLGQQGYERAIERFSIERTAREYMELYRDLTDE